MIFSLDVTAFFVLRDFFGGLLGLSWPFLLFGTVRGSPVAGSAAVSPAGILEPSTVGRPEPWPLGGSGCGSLDQRTSSGQEFVKNLEKLL